MPFPWLSASILFPIAAALLIPFFPDEGQGKQVRWYALGVALITFLLTVGGYLNGYDPSDPGLQLVERVERLPDIGLAWSVGADGISMPSTTRSLFRAVASWPNRCWKWIPRWWMG